MNGIINVLKPPGMSSHQVVSFVRKLLQIKKVGHGGTLDPGASGVLPILVGGATRLSDYILNDDKTYIVEVTLGISTSTQDASGTTCELNTDFSLSPQELAEALAEFQGAITQIPPMSSAVRVGGKRLYDLDRKGLTVARPERQVVIYGLNIMTIWSEDQERIGFGTRVLLRVSCSKGTYIRTICHDLGKKLGIGAHMSFLVRTAVGTFDIAEAFTLEELESLAKVPNHSFLLPMERVIPHLPQVKINPLVEERIKHGNFILPEHLLDVPQILNIGDEIALLGIEGNLLALAEIKMTDQLICQPFKVFI